MVGILLTNGQVNRLIRFFQSYPAIRGREQLMHDIDPLSNLSDFMAIELLTEPQHQDVLRSYQLNKDFSDQDLERWIFEEMNE